MPRDQAFSEPMDRETCYAWGTLFASPWPELVASMALRAGQMGLVQESGERTLVWQRGDQVRVRWLFVDDPSDVEVIRRIFNDEANVQTPLGFVVVRQPDPLDTRGDIIFDVFRLSAESYLWHFYRVFTPPKSQDG